MATEAQILANRANAQKSTGPKTERGKTRSSRNALKHGLCAKSHTLAGEEEDDIAELIAVYEKRFQPQDKLEEDLVRQLAVAQWRLSRASAYEVNFLRHSIATEADEWTEQALDPDAEDALSKLSRHELRLTHRYRRTLRDLVWHQSHRPSSTIPSEEKKYETQNEPNL